MANSALGAVLRALRDRRGLSLRELGTLAEVDHAYIYRLERGEKEAPSDDTFDRLCKHLKPSPHESAILQFVRERNIDAEIALHALGNPEATPDILAIAATAAYRSSVRPDPAEVIRRAIRAKAIMHGQ